MCTDSSPVGNLFAELSWGSGNSQWIFECQHARRSVKRTGPVRLFRPGDGLGVDVYTCLVHMLGVHGCLLLRLTWEGGVCDGPFLSVCNFVSF